MVDNYTQKIRKIQDDVAKQHDLWQEESRRLYEEEKKHYQEAKDLAMRESEKFEYVFNKWFLLCM